MRTLNINELADIQGGGLAGRLLNGISNAITTLEGLYQATLFIRESEAAPLYDCFNEMGDFTGASCRA
jgi:hypothetical protein